MSVVSYINQTKRRVKMDLYYFEMLKEHGIFINVTAGIKEGEHLLIVTDTNKFKIAELIALAAQEKEIDYAIAIMEIREPGEEPPEPIAEAMKNGRYNYCPNYPKPLSLPRYFGSARCRSSIYCFVWYYPRNNGKSCNKV
jgi:hypothetical protein